MSFGADEEILQDFLVEAGEILELLSEQLVELESRPDDMNLLNAIFRGFHTVKGGAGFLQLNELVECCHIAENVFDILRKGERRVDSELMDVVLEALDSVNSMFTEVRERTDLTPATPELLAALARLAEPAGNDAAMSDDALAESEPQVEQAAGDITDSEFEQLLGALHGSPAQAPALPVVMKSPTMSSKPCLTNCTAKVSSQHLRLLLHLPRLLPPCQRRLVMKSPMMNSSRCSISCMAKASLCRQLPQQLPRQQPKLSRW